MAIARVSSTGQVATSPHCSSFRTCEYDESTKQKCATALCNAQGYSGGSFIKASNNFCNASYTSNYTYVYQLDLNIIAKRKYYGEAMITADCTISGDTAIFILAE